MQKKLYKGRLSFDKAELVGNSVKVSGVGINIRLPQNKEEYDAYISTFTASRDFLSMGLFGNEAHYHPTLVANDIVPKPEDYVDVPFRLISATTVGAGSWKATDFSDEALLRNSMPHLEGKTVYKDHEQDSNNWVGLIKAVKWTPSFTNPGDNIKIPAGIDGILAIDSKVDPKLARGLLSGAIYSNSVTVDFTYEMSHHFENEWDFLNKVGSLGSDGKMIRRIVKEINDYHETSLVWLGADPFAKAITTGGALRHVDVSNVYSFCKAKFKEDHTLITEDGYTQEKSTTAKNYIINFGIDKNILPLAAPKEKIVPTVTTKNISMNKFLLAFIAAFGTKLNLSFSTIADGQELTDAQQTELTTALSKLGLAAAPADNAKVILADKLIPFMQVAYKDANPTVTKTIAFSGTADDNTEVVDVNKIVTEFKLIPVTKVTEFEKAVTDVQTLTTEKTTLSTKVNELTKDAEVGQKHIATLRKESVRLYKIAQGDKADAAVITLMEGANNEALQGLIKQHLQAATEKFGGKCTDCGSTNFTFQSALVDKKEPDTKTVESYTSSTKDLFKLAIKEETAKAGE